MAQAKEFNPIETARKIENSYCEYIATTIHFDDADLQRQLEEILRRPGYLAKGPFLEAAPPYRKDKSVAELVDEKVLCESILGLGGGNSRNFDAQRPLYVHQVRAIRKAAAGRNYAVVTGTGSGKTECFILPILNDILNEFEDKGSSAGIRAMILYPMNALANDQLKRLRMLLQGTDITFGRYTGDTEDTESEALPRWKEENPGQVKLPNEIISREEIRKNPPNILLTNYSMLEYLLLRPEDAPLFGGAFGANWRHVAIDEAHIYSGALGTEIAFLLRRLKARIESETGEPPPAPVLCNFRNDRLRERHAESGCIRTRPLRRAVFQRSIRPRRYYKREGSTPGCLGRKDVGKASPCYMAWSAKGALRPRNRVGPCNPGSPLHRVCSRKRSLLGW